MTTISGKSAPAMQPGLRSFIVYNDGLRGTDLVFEVPDGKALPHLHRGDFAIIDTTDREPIEGELFLIEWSNGRRQIAGLAHDLCRDEKTGALEKGERWNFTWQGAIYSLDGSPPIRSLWADGPYRLDYAQKLIIGKVIGIYEGDFRAQIGAAG